MWTGRTTCLGQAAKRRRSNKQMTSNQRRPGFRLPWASESEAAEAEAAEATAEKRATNAAAEAVAKAAAVPPADANESTTTTPSAADSTTADATAAAATPPESDVAQTATAEVQPEPKPAPSADQPPAAAPEAPAPSAETSAGFMRDLVEAMRRVAEETRQSGLSDLRTKAEERVRTLEADAEHRREELKATAETDVAGVGKWSNAETERIKQEAEQRIVARRAQLDEQLAAETTRAEAEATALRDRVAAYERELDAYHAQLSDIADPAAFAAAAKRMPAPPQLGADVDAPAPAPEPASEPAPEPAPDAPPPATSEADPPAPAPNATTATADVHPAEEEVLAARLAELDATLTPDTDLPSHTNGSAGPSVAGSAEPTSTEILVKGLGSFGAITGFRQALAGVDGIEGVSLSLGPTGEFVFRAIHPTGFDVATAISKLEGDAATIEPQAEGGLRVTLDRAR
jgi:hypothetical protein